MIVVRGTGMQVLKCEWEMSYNINYYTISVTVVSHNPSHGQEPQVIVSIESIHL
jgi:hypothetical protein